MNNKTLIALGAAACIVGVGAVLMLRAGNDDATTGRAETTPLFPNIHAHLGQVDRVVIDTGTETITLARGEHGFWLIEEAEGITARRDSLVPILNGFATMQTMEAMTSNPANFDRLGLLDPGEGDGTARRVTLLAGDEEVASLLVGDTRSGWQSTQTLYVRKPGENQTWLVRSPIDVSGNVTAFRDSTLIDIPLERIYLYQSNLSNDIGIHVVRPTRDGGDFLLMNIPEESDVTSQGHLQGPPRALANLTFEDASRDAEFFESLDLAAVLQTETIDGLVLNLEVRREENEEPRYWMSVEVDLSDEVPVTEELGEEFARLDYRHAGLYYRIPQWRATSLLRPVSEMITVRTEPLGGTTLQVPQAPEGTQADPELLRMLQGMDLSGDEFEMPMTDETMQFFAPEGGQEPN